MVELSPRSVDEKLWAGLTRLETAGDDPLALGHALLSVHGALEDFLRLWLAGHPFVPEDARAAAVDRGVFTWKQLLEHLDHYGGLAPEVAELRPAIPAFNRLRNEVAHGGPYQGTRADLLRYAGLVCRLFELGIHQIADGGAPVGFAGVPAERRAHDPFAGERLLEMKIARLDREWGAEAHELGAESTGGSATTKLVVGAVIGGLGAILLVLCLVGGAPVGALVGLVMLVAGIITLRRAERLEHAHADYRQRRGALESRQRDQR